MKTFKEYAIVSEVKTDTKSYQKYAADAIKSINLMIEFGRKTAGLDNKQLNPLLDSIKNIHNGEDAIRISFEKAEEDAIASQTNDKEIKKETGEKKW
jgi:hypothetical protein